ncbi:30S ribosomal protein S14 [archaeon]|nr:30S ribosomal protein S14 [archaeon]
MTAKTPKKQYKQIKHKKVKAAKFKKHNFPKKRSIAGRSRRCTICLRRGAHISKYGLHLCRQCFREKASELGFKKYR